MSDQEGSGSRSKSRSKSPDRRSGGARSKSRSRSPVKDSEPARETSNPGNNLYVANLSYRTSDDDLKDMFEKFGAIEKCELIRDPATGDSRGFGFVTYCNTSDADKAVSELNGSEVGGRNIRVEVARRSRGHAKTPGQYLGPNRERRERRDDRGGGYGRSSGYDRDYNRGGDRGYDRGGYDRGGGYDRDYNRGGDRGYDRGSYDRGGYDRGGYDRYNDRSRGGRYESPRRY